MYLQSHNCGQGQKDFWGLLASNLAPGIVGDPVSRNSGLLKLASNVDIDAPTQEKVFAAVFFQRLFLNLLNKADSALSSISTKFATSTRCQLNHSH